MKWLLKSFAELDTDELYAILRLRNQVFVVEQNCVYQDADNKDNQARHLLGVRDDQLIAYSRLFDPGGYFPEAAIGRVVTAPEVRKQGIGKALVAESIRLLRHLHPDAAIALSGQQHLQAFYEAFGFLKTGDPYLEDGIPHVRMILPV